MSKNVYLLSLGCSKNLVDSENLLGLLFNSGFKICSQPEGSDIAIINTCGFIQPAVEECIENILYLAEKKNRGELVKLIVTGCFVQRYGYKLRREIPEVDGWMGTGDLVRIRELVDKCMAGERPFFINRPVSFVEDDMPRVHTTPFYTSYMKIAEGCSNRCTFCTIPGIRGPLISRKPKTVISEAVDMANQGVKEINLIAQDTTEYGKDSKEGFCLEDLVEKMARIDGLEWIRILYSNPYGISDRLLEIMESEKKVCPYLDIPVQHINPVILKRMGRPEPCDNYIRELIRRIRGLSRRISIRTTVMVGFPGETERRFRELYDFVEETGFDHLGSFVYSPEKGTPAARLKGVPDKTRSLRRRDEIMELQAQISLKKNMNMKGRTVPVLVEGFSPETDLILCGRTSRMAPDVDEKILINSGEGITGEIMPVRIDEVHSYDLIGEIVDDEKPDNSDLS